MSEKKLVNNVEVWLEISKSKLNCCATMHTQIYLHGYEVLNKWAKCPWCKTRIKKDEL